MQNTRQTRIIIIIAIALLAILIALIWWLKPDSTQQGTISESKVATNSEGITNETGANVDETTPVARIAPGKFKTGLEQLPRSLQDTDVDGEIIIDENKQLVVTEGLRRLFDYFLSAIGEEDEATIIARVEAYIRHHTPEPAASQAVEIFHQYIGYLKALGNIQNKYGNLQMQATEQGEMDLTLVAQRRQDVKQLREQYFTTETITAFFGSDDAYDDYSIAMMQIAQDDTLTDAQKQAAREDYISRLPDSPIKQNVQQQANFGLLMERTKQMKARGASQAELYAMRRELVGAAAAERLANVDAEEADFDARFNQYQKQRQALIKGAGSEAAVKSQLQQLESQLFDDAERKRLAGYAAVKAEEAKEQAEQKSSVK